MKQPEMIELLDKADAEMFESLNPPPEPKEIPLPQIKKKKVQWKKPEETQNLQLESPVIEEHRKEVERISNEEAHKLLDQINIGTLDQHISLQKWIQELNKERLQEEVKKFLSRHEINDRIFHTKGFSMLQNYGKVNFNKIRDKIFAMRPNGMNTYCHLCDTCHYEVPSNCQAKNR